MKGQIPYGYENDVEEGENGWVVWKKEKGCPSCKKTEDEDGEQYHALVCPTCEAPGCDECFPSGRGCDCPDCEDDPYDE
jgi:hypothetical protein